MFKHTITVNKLPRIIVSIKGRIFFFLSVQLEIVDLPFWNSVDKNTTLQNHQTLPKLIEISFVFCNWNFCLGMVAQAL